MKKGLTYLMVVFIIAALILFAYGFIHISEKDRPPVISKQDLYIHHFNKFGKQLIIIAEARLKPNYNVIYAYEKTPISLTLEFNKCGECPELENGLTFWFFYEKINDTMSGGSIVSQSPDNFYRINIKPNETKTLHGWVQFTGEGFFRHVLWNSTYDIRLVVDVNYRYARIIPVDESHIAKQIRSNIVIESLGSITAGVSFIMLAFICFQSLSNIENRIERKKELKKLLSKLDEIKPIISNKDSKHKNTSNKRKRVQSKGKNR